MSSAITQKPPCRLSNCRIPNGFKISKKRNKPNAPNANHKLLVGDMSNGIHTPTISSMTTRLGSGPQKGSNWFVAHVPMIVPRTINAKVRIKRAVGEKK